MHIYIYIEIVVYEIIEMPVTVGGEETYKNDEVEEKGCIL